MICNILKILTLIEQKLLLIKIYLRFNYTIFNIVLDITIKKESYSSLLNLINLTAKDILININY